jgi:formate/nitrite transporter FocA (FNT family)
MCPVVAYGLRSIRGLGAPAAAESSEQRTAIAVPARGARETAAAIRSTGLLDLLSVWPIRARECASNPPAEERSSVGDSETENATAGETKAETAATEGVEGEGAIAGEPTPTPDVLLSLIDSAENEMERKWSGLALSGFSAGLDIGFGPLLMAVLLTLSESGYGDIGTELLLASAYAVGFILVILGRSELFTEHTTLAVLPVLDGRASFRQLGRLWGLVYVGNVVGGALFTAFVVALMPNLGVASPEAFGEIAHKLVDHPPDWLFVAGILAGWLMGLLAWLISAAQETISRLLIIWLIAATIGILHLPHSIAGNVEVLFGVFVSSEVSTVDYFRFLALSTVGNIVGGGVFVGLLKYGHVVRGGS